MENKGSGEQLPDDILGFGEQVNALSDQGDDATALTNLLQEMGADEDSAAFVVINREVKSETNRGKFEQEYIDRIPASDFSLDVLKRGYGPGVYILRVYHGDSRGIATKKTIRIAKDTLPQIQAPPTPTAQDLTPLVAAMQKGFSDILGAVTQSQKQQPAAPSRMDILQEMQAMRDMFYTPPPSVPQQTLNPVELLKLGAEMAKNGGAEDDGSWVGKILDRFAPLLAAKLAENPEQAMSDLEKVAVPDMPKVTQIDIPGSEEPMNIFVTQYMNTLKNAAVKNLPVESYAESILAIIPEPESPGLEELLKDQNWRARIAKHTNAVELYPDWFGRLRETLLEYIEEDKQPFEQTPGSETAKT